MIYLIAGIVMIIVSVIGLIYIVTRIRKFGFMQKIISKSKVAGWIIPILPIVVMGIFAYLDFINTLIAVVHLIIFWLLAELVGVIVRKITKRTFHFYWQGLLAIVLTVAYLGIGYYTAYHVIETDYHLTTAKSLGKKRLRIAQISDSHMGTTFDGKGFARHMKTLQKTNPDLIVITGDYVDDDTTKQEMIDATKALGKLKAKYGIYYIYGNHDRGYFNYRDFTTDDMISELKKNNVKILDDKVVSINKDIVLVGRLDASRSPNRQSAKEIMKNVDTSKYVIMLDHEPNDFDNEAKTNADLVLLGHTHGGQMFPIGITGELSGANDKTYGLEKRKNTTFIVNSGISDWAIKFKTGGAVAEFGIIDVVTK